MKKKSPYQPIIGVTPDFNGKPSEFGGKEPTCFVRSRYLNAIWAMGGIPLVLPATDMKKAADLLLDRIDGLLLTGSGPDIPPSLYHEKQKYRFSLMDPLRIHFETALCRLAIKRQKPLLGICGGTQVLNVVLKGSLYQDIPSQIHTGTRHRQKEKASQPSHWVNIMEDSHLYRILGKTKIRVNSSHHQAVKKPGKPLKISAVSPDGVIEGIELPDHPFAIGVQWHPESLYQNNLHAKKIIRAFIKAAETDRSNR
ncbi:MAG: gamma-glutamyl-gamma-aminobutyrate hydrolase family protein [Nitrospirae bacterium]|nr:gamma-glutamyl-gamma-aminobutyrate hydrolase family protein [Nitrospirota bacterium]